MGTTRLTVDSKKYKWHNIYYSSISPLGLIFFLQIQRISFRNYNLLLTHNNKLMVLKRGD